MSSDGRADVHDVGSRSSEALVDPSDRPHQPTGATPSGNFALSASGIDLSVSGELATVTLDRPDRLNAQTPHTWARLRAISSALPGSVRVVLVRATGRAFSAGLDRSLFLESPTDSPSIENDGLSLPALARMDPAHAETVLQSYQAAFGWLSRPELISVAAVQGHAVGAGFQLALACDLRVAADDAVFTMAEVPLGLIPDLGGTRRLVEVVGYARAMDICLTGRRVPATEALEMGLVNRVVASAALPAAADETVRGVLAAPRMAVIEAKALLLAAAGRDQRDQEAAERAAQHRLLRARAGLDQD